MFEFSSIFANIFKELDHSIEQERKSDNLQSEDEKKGARRTVKNHF